jgi:hypothetical protein
VFDQLLAVLATALESLVRLLVDRAGLVLAISTAGACAGVWVFKAGLKVGLRLPALRRLDRATQGDLYSWALRTLAVLVGATFGLGLVDIPLPAIERGAWGGLGGILAATAVAAWKGLSKRIRRKASGGEVDTGDIEDSTDLTASIPAISPSDKPTDPIVVDAEAKK